MLKKINSKNYRLPHVFSGRPTGMYPLPSTVTHSSSPSTLTADFIYGQLGITLFVQTGVISVQTIQKPIIYNFRGKILFCLLSKETCPSNNNNNHVLSAVKRGEGHFIDTSLFNDCFDPIFGISLWNDLVYCRKSSCQFHQHLTRRFLIQKCFAKLVYTFCLSLYFLAKWSWQKRCS